ncbi:protein translocase subunit SecD [[Clostridium] polysaccharolyticum]|uniref:Multifunctional fusion protein n=1 Tax=[Clostridium] polysaccharolyticum TaxID=29364 RepID=A0A1I0DN33_9FIRM|nr:protein translocase subunit SecD [[Clostridium] polysaccharolyticum]SET33521.1 SecD/SecF fusion protein [[Clostridium] polysaccharolyticum]
MKDKRKGILSLCLAVLAIAALCFVSFVGIGKQHKGTAEHIRLGLDLDGGVSITYEAKKKNPSATEMADTKYKLQKRVENYSTEAAVYQEGTKRINVDIPGVTDANAILEELGKAGALEFKDEAGKVVLTGKDIANADANTISDQTTGQPKHIVQLKLNASGTKKFAEATQEAVATNPHKTISIVYDGKVISNPVVNTAITNGEASIEGQKSFEEAEHLASTIRIGALPLELKEIRSNVVGAKLGEEALKTSLIAGLIGLIAVLLFMSIYYRIPGVAASIALLIYILADIIMINAFDVTLTLPGIAGVILSIGMAVDANVIIFTRIREELTAGKSVRSAIKAGFDKALSAIIDGNITTLIAAAVLYFKGSGTVKGFAQTLAIGIVISMFTALFVTRTILTAFYRVGCDDVKFFGLQKEVKTYNYTKRMKVFFAISTLLIAVGIGGLFVNRSQIGTVLNYDLDFSGGTQTQVTFKDEVPGNSEIESVFKDATGEIANVSSVQGEKAVLVKTKTLNLKQRTKLQDTLSSKYGIDEGNIASESISSSVSNEMKSDAVTAVIIATVCMLIYIWIRFKDLAFGASAVIALIHDVLVVLMIYSVCRISVGNTFIACMLTIVGYSINATIVIFDRIRENKKGKSRIEDIEKIVNDSISQTFSRSINTSLTTFIMVFFLAIMGVDSVKEFAIPLMVGIICGCYSSICITGTVWYSFKKIGSSK